MTRDNSPSAATKRRSPNCSPRIWMKSSLVTPFRPKETQQFRDPSKLRSSQQIVWYYSLFCNRGQAWNTRRIGRKLRWRNESWRESTHGLIKLFFHNLGQHLCYRPLLLLGLLFPLLKLRIRLLQQFLRLFHSQLFSTAFPPRLTGRRRGRRTALS